MRSLLLSLSNNAGTGSEVAAGAGAPAALVAGAGDNTDTNDPATVELKNDMRSLMMLLRRDGL
jgi:outer membrane lipoprotein SlyB